MERCGVCGRREKRERERFEKERHERKKKRTYVREKMLMLTGSLRYEITKRGRSGKM